MEFLIPQAASNNTAARCTNAKFRIPPAGEHQTMPPRNSHIRNFRVLEIGVTPTEAPFSGGVQDAAFSRGGGGMAMFAAFPSTNMEAAFGRLHFCGIHIRGWEGGKHSHTTYPYPYSRSLLGSAPKRPLSEGTGTFLCPDVRLYTGNM